MVVRSNKPQKYNRIPIHIKQFQWVLILFYNAVVILKLQQSDLFTKNIYNMGSAIGPKWLYNLSDSSDTVCPLRFYTNTVELWSILRLLDTFWRFEPAWGESPPCQPSNQTWASLTILGLSPLNCLSPFPWCKKTSCIFTCPCTTWKVRISNFHKHLWTNCWTQFTTMTTHEKFPEHWLFSRTSTVTWHLYSIIHLE